MKGMHSFVHLHFALNCFAFNTFLVGRRGVKVRAVAFLSHGAKSRGFEPPSFLFFKFFFEFPNSSLAYDSRRQKRNLWDHWNRFA